MQYGDYSHYHLGGSLKEYLNFAPNNILMWEAIKIACNAGARFFHLGGGLQDTASDSLFQFKSKFSKTTSVFHIGKRIHDNETYRQLIEKWENRNNKKAHRLLEYRNNSPDPDI
jgi:lipid II:glycine glycyltransferase (peptidoglycan interpeptide bridge formation enzyme)